MKKTLTINLNGTVFNIDEDAYELLESYLRNLRHSFRREEGATEIMSDIEARIEELFSNYIRLGHTVVDIKEVESVIAQMGQPADFGMDENASANGEHANEPAAAPLSEPAPKKFYRDGDDKLIAGLCSGLAAYFNTDVLPIRIIAIVLLFGSAGGTLLIYLLLWIFFPEAKTAEEKLKMRGKAVTVENIGKMVSNATEEIKQIYKENKGGFLNGCVAALAGFLKVCLVILGLIVGIPLFFALAVAFIVLISVLFGVGGSLIALPLGLDYSPILSFNYPILASVALVILLVIPFVALVYSLVAYLRKSKPLHSGIKWSTFGVWIIALALLFCSGIKGNKDGFIGWKGNFRHEVVKGNGIIAERKQALAAIQKLEIAGGLAANVQVEQVVGDSFALVIRGESNILTHIDVKTTEHTLTLRNNRHYNLRPTAELIVRLQTPGLQSIDVSGATKVDLAGSVDTVTFEVDASGASLLTINDLHTHKLDVEASGASVVSLSGEVVDADYDASGASHIYAFDLVSGTVDADASGASNIECNPIERLGADASGASRIRYKQEPKARQKSASGASSISIE
ncbi:hypothetical protein AGMMS49525_00740 [Bacteroidia bacterium]|nr:hypothetical protein AGMMS49525_00740 [Bacteroidia bacterium]